MSSNKETVIIHLLGKGYPIVCPAEEAPRLREAAAYLEQKLHGWVRGRAKLPLERIALMAGLELAQECILRQSESLDFEQTVADKLRDLTAALETELC